MINGLLGVAKDNGTATATILNDKGKRKVIKTGNYPEKINIEVKETEKKKEDEKQNLFQWIMSKYRKNHGRKK